MAADLFPINLSLKGRRTLLLGCGRVGRRKLAKLLKAGAEVAVVEKNPDPELLQLAAQGRVSLHEKFEGSLLDGVFLFFAASSDRGLNRLTAGQAEKRGIPANIADDPENSSFTLPALAEKGPLTITVSTGGRSPALSAHLAEELRARYVKNPAYARLALLLGSLRPLALKQIPEAGRETFFHRLAASGDLLVALAGDDGERAVEILKGLTPGLSWPANFICEILKAV